MIRIKGDFKLLLDPGHGIDTMGKFSTDRSLREYQWNREMVAMIAHKCEVEGIDYEVITPELNDISITQRCQRVNRWASKLGKLNVLLISVHVNAHGDGSVWTPARGICSFTFRSLVKDSQGNLVKVKTASENSRKAATFFGQKCIEKGFYLRQPEPGKLYWEQNFGILRMSACPAILTENFFMTNQEDLKFIKSDEGKESISQVHIDTVKRYLEYMDKIVSPF